ncbi:UNVERIFIED_CONTAM: hypothetical protein Slati_0079300 [Sesamum latifolium]|uniref:Transposase MuDR plant domain-containing protein n=1 Tax=Sesamum latifolium TaxID=2727402 RepID=A0AAW2Y906_9LAMI
MVELAVSNRVIEVFAIESELEGENIEGEESEYGIEGDELIESSEEKGEDNLVDSEYGLSEDGCEQLQLEPMRIVEEHDNINMPDEMYVVMLRNEMIFTDAAQFKEAVKAHAVIWQRNIKFVKNDKTRVRAKCQGVNCPWVVLASKMRNLDTFQIKTKNPNHNCGRTLSWHRFVTSKMLSKKYMTDWRLNSGWKLGDFQEKVHNDLNVEVSKSQYYRTKNKVNDILYGKYKDQYTRLYDYCEELRVSNPGSTVVMKTEVDEDSEIEDKNFWGWFLEKLQHDVSMYDQNKWTIVSDRQKGLLPAVYDLLPEVEHRFCVRYMYNNFKKIHSRLALKDRVWKLAKASTVNRFKAEMKSLKNFNEATHGWLSELNPRHWSRSHFRTYPKCDILLNNLCESFNSTILEARNKPLLGMLETIRIYLQKRLQSKRDTSVR